jgi:hypothetical protein
MNGGGKCGEREEKSNLHHASEQAMTAFVKDLSSVSIFRL